jgi:hypothetical protein
MTAAFKEIAQVETPYGRAAILVGRYPAGGAIAVQLETRGTDFDEPLLTFSVNLTPYGARLTTDEFCVKAYAENEAFVPIMEATGLFEATGRSVPSGYIEAPIWRIKDPALVPPVRATRLNRSAASAA